MEKNKQRLEGIERLKSLKALIAVLNSEDGKLFVSERMSAMLPAVLYWATNYEGLMEEVAQFEKETGYHVYHILKATYEFGTCYTFLFVSDVIDEWELEREDLQNGESYAYVVNGLGRDNYCREFGYVGIKAVHGGIARIY